MRLFVSDHLYVDTGSWERRTWFTDSLSSLNNEVENGGFVEENEACLRSHHQLGTGALKLENLTLKTVARVWIIFGVLQLKFMRYRSGSFV